MSPDPEIREFRRFTRVMEREVSRQMETPGGCCGVTVAQCHLLLALSDGGAQSLSALTLALGLDKSTLSRTADALVKQQLVTREENPSDRRLVRIELTAAGRTKAEYIHRESDAYYGRLLDQFSPEERKTVLRASSLLANVLQKAPKIERTAGCACGEIAANEER